MKKKLISLIFCSLFFLVSCGKKVSNNYIGMSRDDVIEYCYKKSLKIGKQEIIIGTVSARKKGHIENITKNEYIMNLKTWRIDFHEGYKGIQKGEYYYKIFFDKKNIVIKQELHFSFGGL